MQNGEFTQELLCGVDDDDDKDLFGAPASAAEWERARPICRGQQYLCENRFVGILAKASGFPSKLGQDGAGLL
jgi:hypothetical protein